MLNLLLAVTILLNQPTKHLQDYLELVPYEAFKNLNRLA